MRVINEILAKREKKNSEQEKARQDKLKKKEEIENGKTVTGEPANKVIINPNINDIGDGIETKKSKIVPPGQVRETVVFSFGRMNPPHIGHQKLVEKMLEIAEERDADARLYLSQSVDEHQNPIPYYTKLAYAQKAFGQVVQETPKNVCNFVDAAKLVEAKNLVVVVGSDRVDNISDMFERLNGVEFHFESIEVVSSGDRTRSENSSSSTKVRNYVTEDDVHSFVQNLPEALRDVSEDIYNDIRLAYGLETTVPIDALTERHRALEEAYGVKRLYEKNLSNSIKHVRFDNLIESVDAITEDKTVNENDYLISEKELVSLQMKADSNSIPIQIIETVYRRGIAKWELIESDLSPSQYAFNRVNSFIAGGNAFYYDMDLLQPAVNFVHDFCEGKLENQGHIKQWLDVVKQTADQPDYTKPEEMHGTTKRPGRKKKIQLIRKIIEQVK